MIFTDIVSILSHPNIVQIRAVNLESVELVMELMNLGSLKDVILRSAHGEGLDINKWRVKLSLDVAEGVTYLHNHYPQIIHRDLKTSNILVSIDQKRNPSSKGT